MCVKQKSNSLKNINAFWRDVLSVCQKVFLVFLVRSGVCAVLRKIYVFVDFLSFNEYNILWSIMYILWSKHTEFTTFGTPTIGIVIASLSEVAKTNATLAWFVVGVNATVDGMELLEKV